MEETSNNDVQETVDVTVESPSLLLPLLALLHRHLVSVCMVKSSVTQSKVSDETRFMIVYRVI